MLVVVVVMVMVVILSLPTGAGYALLRRGVGVGRRYADKGGRARIEQSSEPIVICSHLEHARLQNSSIPKNKARR
jgi:hypothetical protein